MEPLNYCDKCRPSIISLPFSLSPLSISCHFFFLSNFDFTSSDLFVSFSGYGHIAPVTRMGRAATIAYACVGIPLLLMVLADLGRLFTRMIKYGFKSLRKLFMAKKLRKVRHAGRRATLVPQVSIVFIHVFKREEEKVGNSEFKT